MRILRVKNYEKYQNHRAKDPRWIKLYRTILTDQAFVKLDPVSRYVYLGLLILASETGNCVVNDTSYLSHRLAIPASQLNLKPLICSGLLLASLSTIRRQKNTSETETETETERDIDAPHHVDIKPRGKREIHDTDQPTEKHLAFAKSLGIDPGPEWGKFKNYCLAHGKRYVNFEAAFRNWLANAHAMNGGSRVLQRL